MYLIGKSLNRKSPNKIGGAIALFEELVKHLNINNIDFEIVDYNKENFSNPIAASLQIFFRILKISKNKKLIFYNGSSKSLHTLCLLLVVLKCFFRFPLVLRFFGDSLDDVLGNKPSLKSYIGYQILRKADIVFVETFRLHNLLCDKANVKVLPNTRTRNEPQIWVSRTFSKRFVFLGHITELKGMHVLIEAFRDLGSDYQLDIYGPIMERADNWNYDEFRSHYKGSLKPDEVLITLSEYNYLILPSFKEGYPGVVIEALSIGMPLIVSSLPSLLEMLDRSFTEFFEVGDSEGLRKIIIGIDESKYETASSLAYDYFDKFNSYTQIKKVIDSIWPLMNE